MFRNTKPNTNNIDYDSHNGSPKGVNSIYTTFKGGLGGWNDDITQYERFYLWGHLRFCYNKEKIDKPWTHISLHGYKYGYTYSPVKNLLWNFNWHMAYGSKWPFIKIGFHKIWPLIKKY